MTDLAPVEKPPVGSGAGSDTKFASPRRKPPARASFSRVRLAAPARVIAISVGTSSGIVVLTAAIPSLRPEIASGKDLVQEHQLAVALLNGTNPYVPGYLTAHPPTTGLLFLPLAFLDYSTAATVWFGLELLCLALSIHLLARASEFRLSTPALLAISGALLAWHPVMTDLTYGQLTLAQLPFLAGACWALNRRRSALAGALVGIALLIKPFLWPLALPFLLRRDWQFLKGIAGVLLPGYGLTLWRLGFEAHVAYFTQTLPAVADGYRAHAWNISLGSLGWRLFQGTGSLLRGFTANPLVSSVPAAQILSIAAPVALLLWASMVARRMRHASQALGLMICASILASPIAWNHYLSLALVAVAQVVRQLAEMGVPRKATWVASLVGLLLAIPQSAMAQAVSALLSWETTASVPDLIPLPVALSYMEPALALLALAWLLVAVGPSEGTNSRSRRDPIPPAPISSL